MKLTELTVESQQVRSFITHRTRMTQKDKSFCQSVTKSHNTIREPGRERERMGQRATSTQKDRSRVRHLHGEAKITHVVGTLSASADWLTITKGTVYPALSSAPAACSSPASIDNLSRYSNSSFRWHLWADFDSASCSFSLSTNHSQYWNPCEADDICTFHLLHLFHFLFTAVPYDWLTDAARTGIMQMQTLIKTQWLFKRN